MFARGDDVGRCNSWLLVKWLFDRLRVQLSFNHPGAVDEADAVCAL